MKIIISSKTLARIVRYAIKTRCASLEINAREGSITLRNQSVFKIYVNVAESENQNMEVFFVEVSQMLKLLSLLRLLKEQPVVFEISQTSDTRSSIKLTLSNQPLQLNFRLILLKAVIVALL